MSFKYYHAENSNRYIEGLAFAPYQHLGGTWMGIYKSDQPAVQAVLDKAVKNPKSAVTEISAEEYAVCEQKKTRNAKSSALWNMPQPAEPTVGTLGDVPPAGAPVSAELPTPLPAPGVAQVESLEQALTTGDVATGAAPEIPNANRETPSQAGADLS